MVVCASCLSLVEFNKVGMYTVVQMYHDLCKISVHSISIATCVLYEYVKTMCSKYQYYISYIAIHVCRRNNFNMSACLIRMICEQSKCL